MLVVLALLAVVNPLWGITIKPWGRWVVCALVSGFGSLVLMALAATLYDAFRPAGVDPSGPAGMAFLLPAFPYVLVGTIALIVRLVMSRPT